MQPRGSSSSRDLGGRLALSQLTDRQEIADLVYAYCRHFDDNDPDAVAALFTSDAIIDYSPESEIIAGSRALASVIAEGLETIFEATSHHVSNMQLTFESDGACRGVTYLYAWHRYRDGSPDGHLWGRYHHRFVRTEDGWRIAELVLRVAGAVDFHRATMHSIGRR